MNVHAYIGAGAWDRARSRQVGGRLVIPTTIDSDLTAMDFSDLRGLEVTLNAIDADVVIARHAAVRICEDGARLVVLLLGRSLPGEFFYSRPA